MRQVVTQIEIEAPAATVWQILTDFASYERDGWNDYIRSVDAALVTGGRIKVATHTSERGDHDLRGAKLVSITYPELSWEVKLPLPGLIHGKHWFRVEELTATSSRLTQAEQLSGALAFMVFHLVEKSRSGFLEFNEAIKRRAEVSHA